MARMWIPLLATALGACAATQAPAGTSAVAAPSVDSSPPPSSRVPASPALVVRQDGSILVAGEAVGGVGEAIERIQPQPGQEFEVVDLSGGGPVGMELVGELRKAGVERVVVHFEETSDRGEGGSLPPEPPPPSGPPPGARSLPEVKVRNVGLHVGGGPNDEASKEPFKKAVEQRFDDLVACYRLVDAPEKGGDFGVDLRIPREGGEPQVQSQRTRMGGSKFRECVAEAFSKVKFERPLRGPTVISYSVRFSLDD